MKVSTRDDYASRALLSLALHGDGKTPPRAQCARWPTSQGSLSPPRADPAGSEGSWTGAVQAGVDGGYVLAREPGAILLSQIVAAVDGPIVAGDFADPHTDGACDHEGQCVLLAIWASAGSHMQQYLNSFTLEDIAAMSRGESEWPTTWSLLSDDNPRGLSI